MEFVFGEVYALGVAALKYLGDGLPGCAVNSYPTSAMVFKCGYGLHYAFLFRLIQALAAASVARFLLIPCAGNPTIARFTWRWHN
jgi:hypothetical protein